MDNWKKVRIKDISQVNTDTYSLSENWDYVNYLDTGSLTKNMIDGFQFLDLEKDKLPSRARRKVKENDILYSTVRPNQEHYGILRNLVSNMLVSTRFVTISVDGTQADSDYVYYYLTQKEIVDSLQAIGEQSTSAYPSIKSSDIENLEIILPSLETQRKISKILRTIEDKIEINRNINHHLVA